MFRVAHESSSANASAIPSAAAAQLKAGHWAGESLEHALHRSLGSPQLAQSPRQATVVDVAGGRNRAVAQELLRRKELG
jgi:hypothetical protein